VLIDFAQTKSPVFRPGFSIPIRAKRLRGLVIRAAIEFDRRSGLKTTSLAISKLGTVLETGIGESVARSASASGTAEGEISISTQNASM
jgi:hypothetical protein